MSTSPIVDRLESLFGSKDRVLRYYRKQAESQSSPWIARFAVDPTFAEQLGLNKTSTSR